MAKQKVTLEVLSYHATAPRSESQKLTVSWVPFVEEEWLEGMMKVVKTKSFGTCSKNEQYNGYTVTYCSLVI